MNATDIGNSEFGNVVTNSFYRVQNTKHYGKFQSYATLSFK